MENIPVMLRKLIWADPSPPRLVSVDIMRGLTIALMILVNNPGTWSAIYPPLRHARWHGWTITDLVFPFFLFVVGVSIVLALGRFAGSESGVPTNDIDADRRRAVRKVIFRAVLLILLGLFLNAFPVLDFDAGGLHKNLRDIRLPGVLQRIGLCYGFAAILYLYLGRAPRLLFLLLLLPTYWCVLLLAPVPGFGPGLIDSPVNNITAWVDRMAFGKFMYRGGPFDPEGLLSTLPALGTTLLGVHAGEFIASPRKQSRRGTVRPRYFAPMLLLVGGTGLLAGGVLWSEFLPINKTLWTGSYVLLSGGLAAILLGALYELCENRNLERVFLPARIYGVNALLVFVGSALLARTLNLIKVAPDGGKAISLQRHIFLEYFAPLGSPEFASLMYALAWVAGWFVVPAVLYRKRVYIRI